MLKDTKICATICVRITNPILKKEDKKHKNTIIDYGVWPIMTTYGQKSDC